METIYKNGNTKIYLKFKTNDAVDKDLFPYTSFVLGVELSYKTWIDEPAYFKAEEGFEMYGDEYQEFLNELKNQIDNYKEMELEIYDYYLNNNAKLDIDCQKDNIMIKGQLGTSLVEGYPMMNFTIRNLNLSLFKNLYDCLIKHTKF